MSAQPLAGRRILITRPEGQGGDLGRRLVELGATVDEAAAITFLPPENPDRLPWAVRKLDRYAWLVLTSPNGARILVDHLRAEKRRPQDFRSLRVAAIGPATARVLKEAGIAVEIIPRPPFQAEGLLETLRVQVRPGARVLLVRAAEARPLLPEGLRALGAQVEVVDAYRTASGPFDPAPVGEALRSGQIDAVTFTSGSTVRHFVARVGGECLRGGRRPRVICLGEVTARAAEALGLPVDRVADEATMAALAAAVVAALGD